MGNLAEILISLEKYNDAQELLQRVLMLRERTLGGKHEFTLSTIQSLAAVLIKQGRYEKAQKTLESNMKLLSELLGEEHETTLISMRHLAETYWHLHQYSKAEALEVQVLEKHKKIFRSGASTDAA